MLIANKQTWREGKKLNPYDILSLFGIDTNGYEVDPIVEHNEFCDCIYIKEKDFERICPNCGSIHCHINDYYTSTVKHSIIANNNRKLYIKITKIKYKCCDCGHKFFRPSSFVQKGCQISNRIHWEIYERTKQKISLKNLI